jgi:hypothetical protein
MSANKHSSATVDLRLGRQHRRSARAMRVRRSGLPRPRHGNRPPGKGGQDREKNSRASDGSDVPGTDLPTRGTLMALRELAWLRMFVTGLWEFV